MTTFTLPLGAFLARYEPAGGWGTWEEAMAWVSNDPGGWDRVMTLAADLAQAGRFRCAVRVSEAESLAGELYPAAVDDGMHRVCAHMLACRPLIEATYDRPPPPETTLALSFRIEPGRLPGTSAPPATDVFEYLESQLSFPLNADLWAQSDLLTSVPGPLGTVYQTRWDVEEGFDEQIVAAFTARLALAGLAVHVTSAVREAAHPDSGN